MFVLRISLFLGTFKNLVLHENYRYLRFFKCSTDDNIFKPLKCVGNNVN